MLPLFSQFQQYNIHASFDKLVPKYFFLSCIFQEEKQSNVDYVMLVFGNHCDYVLPRSIYDSNFPIYKHHNYLETPSQKKIPVPHILSPLYILGQCLTYLWFMALVRFGYQACVKINMQYGRKYMVYCKIEVAFNYQNSDCTNGGSWSPSAMRKKKDKEKKHFCLLTKGRVHTLLGPSKPLL
jgi:hypothetical protein